ncbi:MAG: PQQ-binding-like beta-propeller repeat protein [Candidatus Glassbacteria bacterium]|nr:PQQ-binding-like beta-propeller repeat protein [Candidatus Glassbacteria bacterium]
MIFFNDLTARWSMEKGSYTRTAALNPHVGVPLELAWKKRIGRSIGATPSAAEDVLFVGTRDRRLVALDRSTGERFWRKTFKGGFGGSVLIHGDRLYFNTCAPEGKAYSLLINFKKKQLNREIGPASTSPIIAQDQLFLFAQSGKVLCLNPEIGYRNWERKLEGTVEYAPVFLDPFLYVATVEGDLYKLDSVTGLVLKHRKLERYLLGDLCSDGVDVFATLSGGKVLCIETDSLKSRWEVEPGPDFFSGPVYADNALYLSGREGWLLKLDAGDGSLIWKTPLEGVAVAAPSLADELVFTGTKSGCLAAYDKENGERLWFTNIREGISTSPLIFKDYVYYCTDRGMVYAFHQK